MDNADAAMPAVPAAVDEVLHAGAGFRRCHAVQVVPLTDRVLSPSQLPDFAPVHTGGGERFVAAVDGFTGRRGGGWQVDRWSVKDPAAPVRPQRNDIGHFTLECLRVGSRIPARHGRGEALLPGLLHETIVAIYRGDDVLGGCTVRFETVGGDVVAAENTP